MRDRVIANLPIALSATFFALFVVVPLATMFLPTLRDADGSFSLALYAQILGEANDRTELWNSLQLGVSTALIALLLGGGFAWVTHATDLPGARWLAPLGVLPLVVPPILVAMGFADFADVAGFWPCAMLLGVAFAPFVAVLGARGLRSADGRSYEAALLARGRGRAELMLLRTTLPEFLAGAFLAFLFAVAERGVPEFLTVKGKTWHTYAEGVFRRWSLRATGMGPEDLQSPVVAAVPLVLLIGAALALTLWLRARAGERAATPLPPRPLGRWRVPVLLVPIVYLGAGVVLPVVVMARWAMGSTQVNAPLSFDTLRASLHGAFTQAGGDLVHTLVIAVATAGVALVVGLPLARAAARRSGIVEHLSVLPLAVPAILLGIGFVHAFNGPHVVGLYAATFDFYDSPAILVAAYAARFLPFAVLTLASATRRIPAVLDEAALLSGRGALARGLRIHLPLAAPAAASAAVLLFVLGLRELDTAVVLPAGNETVVRRLANVVHFGGEDIGGALALLLLTVAVLVPALGMLITGRRLYLSPDRAVEIQLEDLRFGRPAGFALGPLTLTVPTGQRLALVGPSGCGKTTLLRLLAGLERPAGGRILLGGRVASDGATLRLPPNERQLGFVFQDSALWPHLDATAHLRFCDPSLSVDAARALLAQVGLADHATKRPAHLSGGEQQRLALARALVGSPRALLLDEPLHSVDVHLRDGLAVAIRTQAQARGLTTVVVTHDRDEALAIADHVIVLRAGQLVEQGAAAALLREPHTAFGAAFVAGATCLPAARDADGTLRTAFGAFPAPDATRSFVLALLPGDAAITADGPARGLVLQVLPSLDGATAKVQLDGRTLTVAATPDLVAGASVALALRRPPRLLPDDATDSR